MHWVLASTEQVQHQHAHSGTSEWKAAIMNVISSFTSHTSVALFMLCLVSEVLILF